ncbi:MAG: DUF1592 domain-containing protein, partial [Deltaproteobacteria bacterium]|nr:DUF1592 domain-containing protein [Deltaproteobacteria bacterium]
PERAWRLTPRQINEEVARLFGAGAPTLNVPPGAPESGITNISANGVVDLGNAQYFLDGARAIGTWVTTQREAATRCQPYGDSRCVDTMLGWLLGGAFRRPVSAAETAEYRALFDDLSAAYDYDYALSGVVRAVVLSPEFLYRTEIGAGGVLGPHELANLLSYAITDRSPDQELLAAADRNELGTPDQREAWVRKLMATSGPAWRRFFWEWLAMETLGSQAAEVGLAPALVTQMEEEYAAFVEDIAVAQRGGLRDMLTAPHTFVGPELAQHYGVTHPGGGVARVEVGGAERAGLLTQGAWLVSHGKRGKDNVVRRGMNLFKQAMCNNNLAPPEGLDVNAELLALVGPDATVREVVDARGSSPTCGACHSVADPMGIVFESFASDARRQTVYPSGHPVDTAVDVGGQTLTSAAAYVSHLADDTDLQNCFVRRVTHYLVGADMGSPNAAAWVNEARARFLDSDTSLEELVVAIVRHPAFVERQKEISP